MDYLNSIGIMHRDIKPANIIIDAGTYKICDYGLTKIVENGETYITRTKAGT